ncbi:MAG: PadR family transcriptional regulator [Candidatus Izemoplasmatales bacterium]|nr:PadR family transcriptional regulator [Candidatus Izemoplasmatales bacterium]
MNIQYKKGVLEICILAELNRGDVYGYELSTEISKRIEISDGTVYPILRKLKNDGYVTTFLSEASGGPARKYYSITEAGKEKFKREVKDWMKFTKTVHEMLGGGDDETK